MRTLHPFTESDAVFEDCRAPYSPFYDANQIEIEIARRLGELRRLRQALVERVHLTVAGEASQISCLDRISPRALTGSTADREAMSVAGEIARALIWSEELGSARFDVAVDQLAGHIGTFSDVSERLDPKSEFDMCAHKLIDRAIGFVYSALDAVDRLIA